MTRTRKGKCLTIIATLILIPIALMLLWCLFHQGLSAWERQHTTLPGKMVTVSGQQMHLTDTNPKGTRTLVLMSGLGTTAPAEDFAPLIEGLSQSDRVVVVEPLGYGFSDGTDQPRTVSAIVSEYRGALTAAGIPGPYVLVPHSMAGVYATAWMNAYPEEVSAFIGIDPTLPGELKYFGESAPHAPAIAGLMAPLGISRLITLLSPGTFISNNSEGAYAKENLDLQKTLSAWKGYNATVVAENNAIAENMAATQNQSFRPEIPTLIFARESSAAPVDGKTNLTFYAEKLAGLTRGQCIPLTGHHSLHWTQSSIMIQDIQEFLN